MIEVAIVGAGFMGERHATSWDDVEQARVTAVVGTSERAARLAQRLGAARCDSIADLPDSVAAIDICTPTPTHLPLVEQAAARGAHILVEKPVVRSESEIDAIRAAVGSMPAGAVFMVAHVVRFFDGYRRIWELIDQGAAGALHTVRLERWSARPDWAEWLHDEEQSGGPLLDFLVHDLDALLRSAGPALTVHAEHAGDGAFHIRTEHVGGIRGLVSGGSSMPAGFPFTSSIEAYGAEAHLAYSFTGGPADAIRVRSAQGERLIPADPVDAYTCQAREFVNAIQECRRPGEGGLDDAIAAVRLAWAAKQSVATGEVTSLAGRQV